MFASLTYNSCPSDSCPVPAPPKAPCARNPDDQYASCPAPKRAASLVGLPWSESTICSLSRALAPSPLSHPTIPALPLMHSYVSATPYTTSVRGWTIGGYKCCLSSPWNHVCAYDAADVGHPILCLGVNSIISATSTLKRLAHFTCLAASTSVQRV